MILKFSQRLEIYHIKDLIQGGKNYEPRTFNIPSDQMEKVVDFFFWSELDGSYKCYMACKVLGLKKIKVFNAEQLEIDQDSIWDTESNSINYFQDTSTNFMLEMNVDVKDQKINTIFVNGDE